MTDNKRDIERNEPEQAAPAEDGAHKAAPADPGAGGPTEGAPEAAADEASAADRRIAELEAELAEVKDNALRAMAEAENVRKRAERQIADAGRYGAVGLARDMLTISDNLRRALDAAPADAGDGNELLANLRAGVEMTEKELQQALARHGVTEITPRPGEKFDHNQHQAMFEVETDEQPPGTIAQVMQAGYMLHDRLLRAAMVGVAKAPAQVAAAEKSETGGDGGA
jgi:molecular chaperone GrpE